MGAQQLEKGTWTVVSEVQAQDAPWLSLENCSCVMQHHKTSLEASGSPHVQLGESRENGSGFPNQLKH